MAGQAQSCLIESWETAGGFVMSRKVLVWNEYIGERQPGAAKDCYPEGIHEAIAAGLRSSLPGTTVETATSRTRTMGSPTTCWVRSTSWCGGLI